MGNKVKYKIKKCEWVKNGFKYYTGCGFLENRKGKDWEYCPYCGKPLLDLTIKASEGEEINPKRAKEGLVKGRCYKRR